MKDESALIVSLVFSLIIIIGFIYVFSFGFSYLECHYHIISTVLGYLFLFLIIGFLIFGSQEHRVILLFFILVMLVSSAFEYVFSYKGVVRESAEKMVSCKK